MFLKTCSYAASVCLCVLTSGVQLSCTSDNTHTFTHSQKLPNALSVLIPTPEYYINLCFSVRLPVRLSICVLSLCCSAYLSVNMSVWLSVCVFSCQIDRPGATELLEVVGYEECRVWRQVRGSRGRHVLIWFRTRSANSCSLPKNTFKGKNLQHRSSLEHQWLE